MATFIRLMQAIRSIDRRKVIETWRTTFAIVGSAGYAGCLASMHAVLAIVSLVLIGATCAAVYSMLEV